MSQDFSKPITRRSAIQGILAAGAAPMVMPGRLLHGASPSETLRLGAIGTGRKGRGDMQNALFKGLELGARIVAVCDLDANRAADAKRTVEKHYRKRLSDGDYEPVKIYGDYRELIAQQDLDGVLIATPDPWHVLPAMAAAKAGLGIHLQKPLTYSIPEGRALVQVVQANDVPFQTGSQQRSSVYFHRACEAARNGRIGKIQRVEVSLPKDGGRGEAKPMAVPKHLHYDFCIGPTPQVQYTEDRVHPNSDKGYASGRPGWLQIEQYCRGMITGWGAHMFDIAQWGLGVDQDGAPTEVKASASFPDRGLFNVHTDFESEATYPNGVKMVGRSGRPAGVKFIGDDGWVSVQRGAFDASDREVLREKPGQTEVELYKSEDHMADFIKALRTNKRTAAPVEVGHRSNSVCVIHHIAMKVNGTLRWDPQHERFVDNAEANALLDYPHREPWTVG
jgi:predicted dehydrogenase